MKRSKLWRLTLLSLLSSLSVFSCTVLRPERDVKLTRGIGIYPGNTNECNAPVLCENKKYSNIALNKAAFHSSSYDYNLTAQLVSDGIIENTGPAYLSVYTPEGLLAKREREWAFDGTRFSRNDIAGEKTYIEYEFHGIEFSPANIRLIGNVSYKPEFFSLSSQSKHNEHYSIKIIALPSGKTIFSKSGLGLPGSKTRRKRYSDPNKNVEQTLLPMRNLDYEFTLWPEHSYEEKINGIRVEFDMPGADIWSISQLIMKDRNGEVIRPFPSKYFSSSWMSAGSDKEWVYLDFGAKAKFDKVVLHWPVLENKAEVGEIQVSDDAKSWKSIASLPGGHALKDEVSVRGKGRFLRVLMTKMHDLVTEKGESTHPVVARNYVLSEIEVFGVGGLSPENETKQQYETLSHPREDLKHGWKLIRAPRDESFEENEMGARVTSINYNDSSWLSATVPATVLTSYENIGAVPSLNYDDNIFMVSESYFRSDFWYRKTFGKVERAEGERVYLNFDGINWKAKVYMNGHELEFIQGAFIRKSIDITDYLKDKNCIAVHIYSNKNFGPVKAKCRQNTDFNGGLLGADNPTFHASIGWDWISTVRGRNMGIWNNVYLTKENRVRLMDPLVRTSILKLSTNRDSAIVAITPSVIVENVQAHPAVGILEGQIGDIKFQKQISLAAMQKKQITFDSLEISSLNNCNVKLWQPNGYGEPYLYNASYKFYPNATAGSASLPSLMTSNEDVVTIASDSLTYKTGLREVICKDVDSSIKIYVNGQRFIPAGGNWGFSEANLKYRAREYDIAVRYHKDMNFNMIRNWVGQTGQDEFYEACDRYGIMVWQDFWLANPCDGPNPENEEMFMDNANDYVLRIRKHPCIAFYCGRNEGYPTKTLDANLRSCVKQLHPGMTYFSSSADDGVSGHGPYSARSLKEYFTKDFTKFHSEMGMPNVMNIEGLSRTLAPEHLWPQGEHWGRHDFTMSGAQSGQTFNNMITNAFGTDYSKLSSASEFTSLAQFINYNGYRAMFETVNRKRHGLVIWMSHPCWPTMVWQTYDYYFEPTAAYFGAKKACEPLHIQWNAATDSVEVVNRDVSFVALKEANLAKPNLQQQNPEQNKLQDRKLLAEMTYMDVYGRVLYTNNKVVDAVFDSTIPCMNASLDLLSNGVKQKESAVYYLRLRLLNYPEQEGHALLSENFYIRGQQEGNWQELKSLPKAWTVSKVLFRAKDSMRLQITNKSKVPAIMLRLNLLADDRKQILPVLYSDNYFSLMPGESRIVDVKWAIEDARGTKRPIVRIEGFNL